MKDFYNLDDVFNSFCPTAAPPARRRGGRQITAPGATGLFLFALLVMSIEIVDEVLIPEQEDEDDQQKGPIIWNYFKICGVQNKRAGAKNATCIFCDTEVTGCSTSRAFAHILGRPVLGHKKANIKACIPVKKDGDNRYAEFKSTS